jgi:hypothetical protein
MTIKKTVVLLALPMSALALGCTPNDVNIGASARHNNVAQIVEPDPKSDEDQKTEGSVVAGAQERYRTDRVKKPATIRTTQGGSGGGRGGSSGGN